MSLLDDLAAMVERSTGERPRDPKLLMSQTAAEHAIAAGWVRAEDVIVEPPAWRYPYA